MHAYLIFFRRYDMRFSKRVFAFLAVLMVFFMSCDLDVPITEMVKARKVIERASEVKAEKYDSEGLKKAEEHLYKCHDFLKDEDDKNAKIEAEKAIAEGEKAIKKSLPPLAQDSLILARKIYAEADLLFSEKYAAEEFVLAAAKIKESESLRNGGEFWESYLASKQAVEAGESARSRSLEVVPALRSEIDKIRAEAEVLNSLKGREAGEAELGFVKSNLEKAESAISGNFLKDAHKNVTEAGINLQIARSKIQKESVKYRITQIRTELDKLKNERGTDFASEDIEMITSSLNEADAFLDQSKPSEAAAKAEESEKMLADAKNKTQKGIALEKIESTEKLLAEIKKRDASVKASVEIEKAAALIAEARGLYQDGLYPDSVNKAGQAEAVLNSASITIEKMVSVAGKQKDTEKKMYVVKYRKKNTDCLWRIAQTVYKNASLWPLIYMANKSQIKDPDLIFPGQKFVIPAISDKKSAQIEPEIKKAEVKSAKEEDAIRKDKDASGSENVSE